MSPVRTAEELPQRGFARILSGDAQMMPSGGIKDTADIVVILKFLQTNNSGLTLVCDPSIEHDLTRLVFQQLPTVQEAFTRRRLGHDSRVLVVPHEAIAHPTPF